MDRRCYKIALRQDQGDQGRLSQSKTSLMHGQHSVVCIRRNRRTVDGKNRSSRGRRPHIQPHQTSHQPMNRSTYSYNRNLDERNRSRTRSGAS
jgi:hypothetical protein